jgi:hypothetical protein
MSMCHALAIGMHMNLLISFELGPRSITCLGSVRFFWNGARNYSSLSTLYKLVKHSNRESFQVFIPDYSNGPLD